MYLKTGNQCYPTQWKNSKTTTKWGTGKKFGICTFFKQNFQISTHPYLFPIRYGLFWDSLVAQTVKPLPAIRETWAWSLCQEDALKKEMATQSTTLAQKIPLMEEPGGATVHEEAKSRTRLSNFTFHFMVFSIKGEGIRNKEVIHS